MTKPKELSKKCLSILGLGPCNGRSLKDKVRESSVGGPVALSLLRLSLAGDGEDSLASTVELSELVSSPGFILRVVIPQVGNSLLCVVSLADGTFVSLVDVVMERVFEGNGVVLLGALDTDSESSYH